MLSKKNFLLLISIIIMILGMIIFFLPFKNIVNEPEASRSRTIKGSISMSCGTTNFVQANNFNIDITYKTSAGSSFTLKGAKITAHLHGNTNTNKSALWLTCSGSTTSKSGSITSGISLLNTKYQYCYTLGNKDNYLTPSISYSYSTYDDENKFDECTATMDKKICKNTKTDGGTSATFTLTANPKVSYYTFYKVKNGITTRDTGMYLNYRTSFTYKYPSETGYHVEKITNSSATFTPTENLVATDTLSYYIYYAPNTYTVKLDAQNGSGENDGTTKVTATYNSAMPSITIPSKKGYTFQGYYTSKNGGGTKYYNANGTSARTCNITSNTTLYAYWTANGYRLTAYANEGKFNSFTGWNKTNDTTIYKTVLFDSALGTLPTSLVSRDGYTFSRWTNSSSGGTEIKSSSIMNNTNGIKIYAQWTPKTYTITLNSDGGSGGSQSVQVVFDSNIPSITVPSKIGYVFQGYYTSKNGGGTQYINADGTSTRTWNIPSNTTLYAKWDKATYRIDVNILNPAGVQDYVSGTMCQTYKGSSKVAADQAFSNIKFQESFTISQITPIDGLILSSVTATDGRLVDNQNGTYTFTADFNRQPKGGLLWDASVNIKLGYTWVNYATAPTEMQNIKRDDGVYVQAKVISKPGHLAWLAKESFSKVLEGYYIQTNSIDMSKYYWYPIKNFRGVYLGQSYPISNLKTSQYTISQSGLFGTMETGSVCDGVVVIGTQIYGAQYTGGIAAINNGTIKNSFVQGNITATDRGVTENNTVVKYHVGGIAGKSSSGVIQNSIFEGSVVKSSTNTKDRYLGLISGYGGTIKDCLASSTISTAFTNSATTINSCIYRINNTKKYYNGTFENWVIVGGNPYPSGITWIGNGGIKVTSVEQIKNLGYVLI